LLASDHGRVAFGRRIAGRHHDGGTSAILLECVRSENVRDEAAIGELGDTACGITGDAVAEVLVVDVAAVGVGSEPLAGCERIAAGTMQREPAVGATNRERAAIRGDKDIRHR
jgi:hypothetical protein